MHMCTRMPVFGICLRSTSTRSAWLRARQLRAEMERAATLSCLETTLTRVAGCVTLTGALTMVFTN